MSGISQVTSSPKIRCVAASVQHMLIRMVATDLSGMVYERITKNSRMMIRMTTRISICVNSPEMISEMSYMTTAVPVTHVAVMPELFATKSSTALWRNAMESMDLDDMAASWVDADSLMYVTSPVPSAELTKDPPIRPRL